MLTGALAQSVPDIDFIASFWMEPTENLLAHRGFTHSLLFVVLVSPFLALLAERWHRPHDVPTGKWIWFFAVEGMVHILLDGFNVYGVGWLEPFSNHRFSFNTIFVADPLFSAGPAIAFLLLLRSGKRRKGRKIWAMAGLFTAAAYLTYTVGNKLYVDKMVKRMLKREKIAYDDYFSTPTPLNNWLWYVVIRERDGYYIAYHSVFDTVRELSLHYFPRQDSLLEAVSDQESLQHLIRFSKGYYTLEKEDGKLVFNDIRFGQIIGWVDPQEKFVFHYYLHQPSANDLVVQRGRFAGWNRHIAVALLRRIIRDQ